MARSQRRTTYQATGAIIRNIIRRLDALEQRLGRNSRANGPTEFARRWEILEENRLRDQVARDEAFSKRNPELWRQMEVDRRARNRKTTILNKRLRAEGLRPVTLDLSLAQRVKKLQQLEARNHAQSSKLTASS